MYDYWLHKRDRLGKSLLSMWHFCHLIFSSFIPSVKGQYHPIPDSSDPSPYVAFRIRDKEGSGYRLRRPRRNNEQTHLDIREIRVELEVNQCSNERRLHERFPLYMNPSLCISSFILFQFLERPFSRRTLQEKREV